MLKRETPFDDFHALFLSDRSKNETVLALAKLAGRTGLDGVVASAEIERVADLLEQNERERVVALGGLHILGTERHESRRIDNQLRGRSGRQGDPGASRFFLSLDQQLFRPNFAQIIVLTPDIAARERVLKKMRKVFADGFPGVRGRVSKVATRSAIPSL